MSRKPTPEEVEKIKAAVGEYRTQQLKLIKKRTEFQQVLDDTASAVAQLGDREGPGAEFMRLQLRVAELGMRQMEAFDLDQQVYKAPTETDGPAFELRQHELDLAVVRQDFVALTVLHGWVQVALGAIAAGSEPQVPEGVPEAWATEAALLVRDEERRAKWERFVAAYGDLAPLVAAEPPETAAQPGSERLAWMKKQVPALKGVHYRVRAALRLLPTGEEIMRETRAAIVAELKLVRGAKPAPRRAPAVAGKKTPALTDRLRGIFKSPQK